MLVVLVERGVAALGIFRRLGRRVHNGVLLLLYVAVRLLGGVVIRERLRHVDQTGLTGVAVHVLEGVVVGNTAAQRGLLEVLGALERLMQTLSEIQIAMRLAFRLLLHLLLLLMKSAAHFILLLVEERHPVDCVPRRAHMLIALEQGHLLLAVDVGLRDLELC